MNQRIHEEENGLRLALSGEITITNAVRIREVFLELLDRGRDSGVDLSGATDIDVSGLQLLCSLHRTAAGKGLNVHLDKNIPGNLAEVIKTAGCLREKGCKLDVLGTCLWKGVEIS
jgi:ABC-type transporter Mla MlaB component